MEMTNRRWLAIAALSCALLASLRLPPHGVPRQGWTREGVLPERDRAARLHARLVDLNDAVALLARRDSLLAAARSAPGRTTPLIVATAPLRDGERNTFERAVAAQASAIGSGARSLILGVVIDSSGETPRRINYRTERQFLAPPSTDGENCIALVRLGRGRRELSASARMGIFGPCAFYAAFGEPGPAIGSWLRGRGYDVAFDAILPARPEPDPDLLTVRTTTRDEDLKRWLDFSRAFRYHPTASCSSGDLDACARAIRPMAGTRNTLLSGVAFRDRMTGYDEIFLGWDGSSFLSDLLAEQGHARFEKFWKSPADLETAFKSAFGQSTGEWTMRWMQYKYGKDTRGPYISSRSALASLLASLGFVGFSALMAHRREAD